MVSASISPLLILSAVAALLVMFLIQPLVLRVSCSMCGEKGPGYLTGFGLILMAWLAGGVANTVYGLTLGMLIASLSSTMAAIGAVAVSLLATAVVYSAFLRISVFRGAGVAVVHHLLGIGLTVLVAVAFKLAFVVGLF